MEELRTFEVVFCVGPRVRTEVSQKVHVHATSLEEAFDVFSSIYNWTAIISVKEVA